jgi:hypothetical protein
LSFASSLGKTCNGQPQLALLEVRVLSRVIRRGSVFGIPTAIQESRDSLAQALAREVVKGSLLDRLALVASSRLTLAVLVDDVRTKDLLSRVDLPRATVAAL